MKTYLAILIITLSVGCTSVDSVKPEPQPRRKEWPQRCEMCGAKWLVTPIEDPDAIVPPTVEWCFYDGSYCDVGLDIMIESQKSGETDDLKRQWLNHCLKCKGCRCAAFDPDEWRKVTTAIRQVQQGADSNESKL